MVLKRQNSPAFEEQESDVATATPETPAAGWSSEDAPTPQAPRTAVAAKATNAVATSLRNMNAIKDLKDAYKVQYNSLAQITATQGNFGDRESNTNFGDRVVFELMSYQNQFVISPNDDKAPKDLVRYSDDGITCSDGTDVKEWLSELKGIGWNNARINQRYILVGALISADKTDKFNGSLMQIDLSPKSKDQFDRYILQSAYNIGKGLVTAEDAKILEMRTEIATNSNNQKYTLVKFSTHKPS